MASAVGIVETVASSYRDCNICTVGYTVHPPSSDCPRPKVLHIRVYDSLSEYTVQYICIFIYLLCVSIHIMYVCMHIHTAYTVCTLVKTFFLYI